MKVVIALSACLLISSFAFGKAPDPTEVATVHIYRNSAAPAMLWKFRVKINGKKVKIKNGCSYELKVTPGVTNLAVTSLGHDHLLLNLEPGKEYYIKSFLRAGLFAHKVELAEVTEAFAKKQIEKIKPTHKRMVIL